MAKVRKWKVRFVDGQTVYVDAVNDEEAEKEALRASGNERLLQDDPDTWPVAWLKDLG